MTDPTLALSESPPPRQLAEGAEVYLVSGYESKSPRTVVRVHRPGRRVLLVLTSYENILWQVLPTPGTELAGVLVAGFAGTSALQAPPGTQAYRVQLPYAYEVDNANFRELLRRLQTWFGLEQLDGVRGAYALPAEIELREPDAPSAAVTAAGEQPQPPRRNFKFSLLSADLRRIEWTPTGPAHPFDGRYVDNGRIALSPDGSRVWRLRGDQLEVLLRGEAAGRPVALPPDFPRFSWATDLAYDTHRGVLTIVTLGGEGFLYRYDTRNERWLDVRSLRDVDIQSLAFDTEARRYVAWTSEGRLLSISAEGDALMERGVLPLLAGFGALYDRGNASPPRLTLAPNGDEVALIAVGSGQVRYVWVYDWRRNEARMTWKARESGR